MSSDSEVGRTLASHRLPVKPCGLNADWCVSAWHLSPGQPNTESGDFYLLDSEERDANDAWLFEIVKRTYTADDPDGDGNDTIDVVYGPASLERVVNMFVLGKHRKGQNDSKSDQDGEQQGG